MALARAITFMNKLISLAFISYLSMLVPAAQATWFGLPCIDYDFYRAKLIRQGWKPVCDSACGRLEYKELTLGNRMGSATWLSPNQYKLNMPLWGNGNGGYCLVPQADEDR